MEDYGPNYFATTDRQLAFALVTAGCKFAPQTEDGRGGPCFMIYTPNCLRDRGIIPKGQGVDLPVFDRKAREAFEQGIPGDITYLVVRDEVFEESIKAWDEMVDGYAQADRDRTPPPVPVISATVAMQVQYMRRVNEGEMPVKTIGFYNPPRFRVSSLKTDSRPMHPDLKDHPGTIDTTRGTEIIWGYNTPEPEKRELWEKFKRQAKA